VKSVKKLFILLSALVIFTQCQNSQPEQKFTTENSEADSVKTEIPIVDSRLTLEEALRGNVIPDSIRRNLTIVSVTHWGYDNKLHIGQLVCDKTVQAELSSIFDSLRSIRFPIESVRPICQFGWSDDRSMANNNTSCFNYRTIAHSSRISQHAYGRAIDINPFQNPYVSKSGNSQPEMASYNPDAKGTITQSSQVVEIFKHHGWGWGGNWRGSKDYQHFSKNGR